MVELGKITVLCKERGISLKDVAGQAGITYQGLNKIIRSNSTTIETLVSISAALNVSPCVFFERKEEDAMPSGIIAYLKDKDNKIEELIFKNATLTAEIEQIKKRAVRPGASARDADAG